MQEDKNASSSYFITLTYDPKCVPYTEDGRKTIDKKHLQLFFKRLRSCQRRMETKKFRKAGIPISKRNYSQVKYYAVGEYGKSTRRPHYHAILFNADVSAIETAWRHSQVHYGTVHYGEVTGASVGYTLKYISKKSRIGIYDYDTRNSVFSLMSKGLGQSYLTPQMIAWHQADQNSRMYCQLTDGRKIAMPRYYKLRIYSDEQRRKIANALLMQQIEDLYQQAILEEWQFDHKRRNADIEAANRKHHYQAFKNESL